MENHLDKIGYIIIAIIIAIVSAINSAKKKKKHTNIKNTSVTKTAPETNFFYKEVQGIKNNMKREFKSDLNSDPHNNITKKNPGEESLSTLLFDEGSDSLDQIKMEQELNHYNHKKQSGHYEKFEFDPKKAIIYSEILKRKYF